MYNGPNIVTNGLVLALDAANRNSYVSGSTIWRDISGTTLSGSLVNSPTFNSSNNGSIVFDGVNDYVNLGSILNYTSQDFSFSVLVYLPTATANKVDSNINTIPIFYKGSYITSGYYCTLNLPAGFVSFITNQSGVYQSTAAYISTELNKWHSIVITRVGPSVNIYYNGINAVSVYGTHVNPLSTTNNFTLGSYEVQSYNLLARLSIANFAVYNRALSAQEVLQNYNALKGRFGLD